MTKQLNKTKKFTFTNDFHNTEVTVIGKLASTEKGYIINEEQLSRINRKLCGMSDCSCGGIRGKQGNNHNGFEYEHLSYKGESNGIYIYNF